MFPAKVLFSAPVAPAPGWFCALIRGGTLVLYIVIQL